MSRMLCFLITNLCLMVFFQGDNLPRKKDRVYFVNLDDKVCNEKN